MLRKKSKPDPDWLEEEVRKLEQKVTDLEAKKKELEQLLAKKRKEIDTLNEQLSIGKKIYVLIRHGPGYAKVKGKVTVAGIVFKYMNKKWEIPFDPSHFFYMKHGIGRAKLTVYVDLDKMYTIPPPASGISVEREIDSRAVQAVLTIYRSILFGQRREQLALMAGLIIALAGLAIAMFAIWQYNNTIHEQLQQLQELMRQMSEILKQYPPAPNPVTPPGG